MKRQTVFLTGIFLTSIVLCPGILDLTLVPRFSLLALTITVLLWIRKTPQNYRIIKPDSIVIAYVAFVALCFCSVIWSNTRSEAWFSAERSLLGIMVFLITAHFMRLNTEATLRALIKLSVLIFFCGFCFAGIQFLRLPAFNKENMYSITGLYSHKNLYASFLFLHLVFSLAGIKLLNKGWKIASAMSLLLAVAILVLLRTRAVYVGFAIVAILYTAIRFIPVQKLSSQKERLAFVLILLVLLNVFFLYLLPRLIQWQLGGLLPEGSLMTDRERLVVWDKTYHILHKSIFFGCGAGNWQFVFPDATLNDMWRVEDMNVTFQRPHNDFLWMLSETGMVGLNLFLFFVLYLCVESAYVLKISAQSNHVVLVQTLFPAFMMGYFAISFFDFPAERPEHVAWINIITGITFSFILKQKEEKAAYLEIKPGLAKALSMLILTFVLITGFLRIKGEFYTRTMYDEKRKGNLQMVINAAEKAESFAYCTDPTSVPLSWYSGNAKAASGNYTGALQDFETAKKQAPYNRNVLNDLASAYSLMKRNELAIPLYEEAARISPRFDDPKLNLAAIYINEADYDKARYWLNRLLHDSPRRSSYEALLREKDSTGANGFNLPEHK